MYIYKCWATGDSSSSTHMLLRKQIYLLDASTRPPDHIRSCPLRPAMTPPSLTACSSTVMPYPRPIAGCARPSQSPAPLDLSPSVRPPSLSCTPLTPSWRLGRTCRGALGLPRPRQGYPRAWRGARTPLLAAVSHPNGQNRPASVFPFSMLHIYVSSVSDVSNVCCNYFILMLQK
jgi:hypothetical protein